MQIKRQKPQTWLGREREQKKQRQATRAKELKREREREGAQSTLTYNQKQSRQHFHSLFAPFRLTMRNTNKYIYMSVDMVLRAYRKLAHRWTGHGHLI